MVAITRSGVYYLVGFGLAFFAGFSLGNFQFILFGLTFLLWLILGLRRAMPRDIVIDRKLSATRMFVGETVEVEVEATIAGGFGIVLLHDRIPSMFEVIDGNNVHVVWKGGAPKRVRYTYTFKATKRGGYNLGGTTATAINAFALTESVPVARIPDAEMTVEPRVLRVRNVKPMRGKARTIFPSGDKARVGTRTTDFHDIRDYERGDPLKNVNWRATARRSTDERLHLMVNEYEVEGKKAIWFFIDAADYMEVGSTLQNTFDQTVEAALEILEHFIDRGYRVGGTVFNTVGRDNEAPVFYPDHGRSQYIKIVKVLTGLATSNSHEGLPAAVERVRGFLAREKPLVLLVTRPEADFERLGAGIKRLMTHVSTNRAQPPIMLIAPQVRTAALESQSVDELAVRISEREAYARHKALRRMGVTLVEWDPQQSPLAAVLARGVRAR